jgi:hypothetical protein
MNVLLRMVLILLLVFVGLMVGITLAPRLARVVPGQGASSVLVRGTPPGSLSAAEGRTAWPDWGGGRLSFPVRSAAGIVDSVRKLESRGVQESGSSLNSSTHQLTNSKTRAYSGQAGGVVLRQKSGADYALTLALPSLGQPGRSGLFELPSFGHFKKQLLPGAGDAEAPAADIPLYPQSSCRMQVGHGTACFVGFYLTPDSVEAVRSFYVRVLSQLGWQRVTADRPGLLETFAKRNEDRAVVVQLRKQDPVTTRIGLVAMTSGSPDRNERK